MTRLLAVEIRCVRDVASARQRTRQIAGLLGFDTQDQVRLATAASEVARNAYQYAGGGRAEFAYRAGRLEVTVRDDGPGIPDLGAVLDGRYVSPTGPGLGLVGTRRLMDEFAAECAPDGGTVVRFAKALPRGVPLPTGADLARVAAELAGAAPDEPITELHNQNQELLRALSDIRERETRLAELNRELEETNRGVVALYAELEEKADTLKRVSDLKTRFLSNMSHEFSTPLSSILSLSQFLLDRTDGPLTPEQEKQVQFIRRAAHGLSELVNDLLDLAKVEAGKVVVRPERFSVADLFGTLRGMMRPLQTNDAVALHFDAPGEAGELYTDEGKLSQILRNFVSNALKFTERGEVRVSASADTGDEVVFAVADTGIGIAPADQAVIFEEFGQVESAIQKRVTGTGLGLPLSKRLAELLGGRVWVHSRPGEGSTFFLAVPRQYGAPADAILIVDDDEIARYVLRGLLDGTPFRVLEAAGGRDGLRRAREDPPRVIFLDVVMPDLSGFEVLDRLKADPATRDVPVIVYTSQDLDEADRRRLGAATAILSKGASREQAAREVRAALARAGVEGVVRV
jgi:signal transduction histidine kinase/CheY-like chemotaxis protein